MTPAKDIVAKARDAVNVRGEAGDRLIALLLLEVLLDIREGIDTLPRRVLDEKC